MFHSFSAAKTFGEKEEKSIKKCYLHFISLLLFLFLDAFSNLGGGGGGTHTFKKDLWAHVLILLSVSLTSSQPRFHSYIFKVRYDIL